MKSNPRVWLFCIFLAAFALRLYRLGVPSLWYDETVSVILAQKDLLALTQHTAGDIHPPLYYYLLHFWGRLAGWSEFSAAFLSLFFGVLLIALVYRVARDLTPSPVQRRRSEGVGVLAALLVAASPYNLWYSQEVRMYTLGAVLGLASTYFFVRVLAQETEDGGRRTEDKSMAFVLRPSSFFSRNFLAYAGVSALGLYTLYYFAFLLVFQNLAAFVWMVRNSKFRIPNSEFRIWISSQFAILVLYLPWLPIALRQAIDPPVPPWRSFTSLPNVLLESFSALALGQSLAVEMTFPIVLFIVALFVFTLVTRHASLFWLGYTFAPLIIIFAFSLWKPLYHVRYIFIYSPGFYLLWAIGLERVFSLRIDFRKYATSIIAGSLLLISAIAYSDYNFWFDPKYADDDLRGAAQRIAELWRPGDAGLINAGYTYPAFVYYFDQPMAWRGRLVNYPPRDISMGTIQRIVDLRAGAIVLQTGSIGGGASLGWGSAESDFYATTAEETRAALDRVFAAHPRVWMLRLYDTVVDPDGVIRDYLATRGRIIDDQGFAGESFARVQGYLTTRAPLTALPASATRREVFLGNRIALLGFEPKEISVRVGEPIDVNLYWQAREPTNVDMHLYVGLFAGDGKPVAATDEVPLGNALGTSRWTPGEVMRHPVRLRVPANIAPGNYVLRVALYNPLTNESLGAEKSEWVAENGQVVLTMVRVERER
jgi:uncharacterized membrane protein